MPHVRSFPAAIGIAVALAVAFWCSRLYTVPDPWSQYNRAVRRFLAAGSKDDSATLASSAASPEPIAWVHRATVQDRELVKAWSVQLSGVTGERRGDTVAVVLWAPRLRGCSAYYGVSALLLNHSSSPRVLALGSRCTDAQSLPVLQQHPFPQELLTGK
jgi:hypothetical protein